VIKQNLNKLFSITLALLVLFSTVSLTIEKHYCGDVLVDVSVLSQGQSCSVNSDDAKETNFETVSCCKSHIDVVQGQDTLAFNTFTDLEYTLQLFLNTYIYSFSTLFENLSKRNKLYNTYLPPKLIVDLHVVNNVFLI